MAITQQTSRRIREAINKKIERQIKEGLTPLTTFKSYFPFEAGGDIIDRRTGKVKGIDVFVAEQVRATIGTESEFVAKFTGAGGTKGNARAAYAREKAIETEHAKETFRAKVGILSEMTDLTNTKDVERHWLTIANEVEKRFLDAMQFTFGTVSDLKVNTETGETEEQNPYWKAYDLLAHMKPRERIKLFSDAGKKVNAQKHTISYYQTIAEMLGVDEPETETP